MRRQTTTSFSAKQQMSICVALFEFAVQSLLTKQFVSASIAETNSTQTSQVRLVDDAKTWKLIQVSAESSFACATLNLTAVFQQTNLESLVESRVFASLPGEPDLPTNWDSNFDKRRKTVRIFGPLKSLLELQQAEEQTSSKLSLPVEINCFFLYAANDSFTKQTVLARIEFSLSKNSLEQIKVSLNDSSTTLQFEFYNIQSLDAFFELQLHDKLELALKGVWGSVGLSALKCSPNQSVIAQLLLTSDDDSHGPSLQRLIKDTRRLTSRARKCDSRTRHFVSFEHLLRNINLYTNWCAFQCFRSFEQSNEEGRELTGKC